MSALPDPCTTENLPGRLARVDWHQLADSLNSVGAATIASVLSPQTCSQLAELYQNQALFRSHVVMERHNFGRGEYRYFRYPLPGLIAELRRLVYPPLALIANDWNQAMGIDMRYPQEHEDYLRLCHAAGQQRPTPLLLRYEAGDYNCLHQDIYGEHVFPLQMVVLLSAPGTDFTGGELVLTEQRPRMQSRPEVLALQQGDAAVFPVRHRPVKGTRGVYRVNHRHGVSRVHGGLRHTLGLIFHDAA